MSLDATPIRGSGGEFHGVGITWEIVTGRAALAEAARRTEQMIDGAPINSMYCDKDAQNSVHERDLAQNARDAPALPASLRGRR